MSQISLSDRRADPKQASAVGRSLRAIRAIQTRWHWARRPLYERFFPFRLKPEYEDLRRPARWTCRLERWKQKVAQVAEAEAREHTDRLLAQQAQDFEQLEQRGRADEDDWLLM